MKAKKKIKHLKLPFEVAAKDLPGRYEWQQAMDLMPLLGDGWRLPTDKELNLLYINKAAIGGFIAYFYWSSSAYSAADAWYENFYDGNQSYFYKTLTSYVRCVRSLTIKKKVLYSRKDVINLLSDAIKDNIGEHINLEQWAKKNLL